MNEFFNKYIFNPIMKFVNTRPMNALKNGMLYAMPFIIIGSVFLILANIPYLPAANWLAAHGFTAVFSQAYAVTFGILAVWACVGIAYTYVKDAGIQEALPAGLTALASFFIVQSLSVANPLVATMGNSGTGITNANGTVALTGSKVTENIDKLPHALQAFMTSPVTGVLNLTWLGGQGMFAAIIIGILTGWGYSRMIKAGWKISLPEQVPSNVANQFTAMIPSAVIIAASAAVFAIFKYAFNSDLLSWIYATLQHPLQGLGGSFWGIMIIALLVPFFWFFGVHGGLIMGAITSAFLIPNTAANAALYQAHKLTLHNGAHIVTNEFYNNFINLTGSGITFGLVIFALFFAKSEQMKSLGKIEAVPGLFNINEPFLFGLPLVLNPILALPFFLVPALVAATVYFAIASGIVPPLNGVAAPWTTPPIISGFLIGGWKFAVLQVVVLAESTIVYLPFARRFDKVLLAQEKENEAAEEAAA